MDRKVVGAVLAISALVAGGCGSSAKPLARAEFVRRADAACRRISDQISRSTRGPKGLEGLAVRTMTADSEIKQELDGLTPPKHLKTSLDQYKKALDDKNAFIKRVLPLIRARKFEHNRSVEAQGRAVTQRESTLAKQLGLKSCS